MPDRLDGQSGGIVVYAALEEERPTRRPYGGGRFSCLILALALGLHAGEARAQTMQDALASARAARPELLAARHRVEAADHATRQAQRSGRAEIALRLSGVTNGRMVAADDLGDQAASFSQTAVESTVFARSVLYDGGRRVRRAEIFGAESALRAAERDETAQRAMAEAAEALIAFQLAIGLRELMLADLDLCKEQVHAAEDLHRTKNGTLAGLRRTERTCLEAQLTLGRIEDDRIAAMLRLRQTGIVPIEEPRPVPFAALPRGLDEALRLASARSGPLRIDRANEAVSKAAIGLAERAYAPRLVATGSAGYRSIENEVLSREGEFASVGLGLDVPLWASGRAGVAAEARALHRADRLDAEAERARLLRAVETAWTGLERKRHALEAAQILARHAAADLEEADFRLQIGTGSRLDVIAARRRCLAEERTRIEREADLVSAGYAFLAMLGTLDPDRSASGRTAALSYTPAWSPAGTSPAEPSLARPSIEEAIGRLRARRDEEGEDRG